MITSMNRPELVLSNTTTFFSGNLEKVFRKAKKYGFKYLEIIPYRWTKVKKILDLENHYDIKVIGIHLPPGKPKNFFEKILNLLWAVFLGPYYKNPGLALAEAFKNQNRDFYLLCHADLASEMGPKFTELTKRFPVVVENIPRHPGNKEFYWNPVSIQKALLEQRLSAGLVFDPEHFQMSQKIFPSSSSILETYREISPKAIHISYSNGSVHTLPNQKEIEDLKQMLKIHSPKYIILETNPLVSVKKGKEILKRIVNLS